MIQPQYVERSTPAPYRPLGRFGKTNPRKRKAQARRARYANSLRVVAMLGGLIVAVMVYVSLTANVTGLSYAISHAEADRAQLLEEAQQMDDRIAHLESRDRLAVIAAKLKMTDPQRYAIVAFPAPQPAAKPGGLAFLEWFRRP